MNYSDKFKRPAIHINEELRNAYDGLINISRVIGCLIARKKQNGGKETDKLSIVCMASEK